MNLRRMICYENYRNWRKNSKLKFYGKYSSDNVTDFTGEE